MAKPTGGVVFIHSAPWALRPHIEWALSAELGAPLRFDWQPQEAEPRACRAEAAWSGPAGSAARLATTLRRFPGLRFEVTEDPTAQSEGLRFAYTPDLGLFHAQTDPAGDLVVTENQLRAVLRHCQGDPAKLLHHLSELLGERWDEELEPFRLAGAVQPTGWLRAVV
jgi:hypothetical protein